MYDFSNHESFVIAKAHTDEQARIVKLVEARLCEESLLTGDCEHSACGALFELRAAIQGVELHDE